MFLRDLLQPMHLIVLLVIYLLFFGTKKVPQFGKQLGEGLRGIREGLRGGQEEEMKPADPRAEGTSPGTLASSAEAPALSTEVVK